ncbi:superoxide dismutase [Mn] [Buchnera aphidicola (Pemphigus obesinymphae)]|uniref:Fe-Mn family superoxide dismutase n=1 Tax=Buchnera aphidicola TaxID=9 RepID=UPI0022370B99|nr:Fe-Mn family superoxide dismutase [Buchnera aphidicola]MCW5196643.1 superoxide dismutase [Mn] [Buchnera aphidicola (Pemphigus obesinymphae)]
MIHMLPVLPYSYDFLEPYFDKETMFIHHTKHHQTYINNLNIALKGTKFLNLSIDNLIIQLDKLSFDKRKIIQNNAGGHINHSLFWKGLKIGTNLSPILKKSIEKDFNSISNFKKKFEEAALNHFGSGWVWLIKNNSTLSIVTTVNQDNPLMGQNIAGVYGIPIISLDLWEHAYYLKYQNKKIDYIKAFWNVVNWDEALNRFTNKNCFFN